jgi:tryptophan synthase alpha chain
MVRTFRQDNTHTPVVLMGYANPIERYDQRHAAAGPGSPFVQAAAQAGVDGLLVVDYPPEECTGIAADLRRHGMDLIFLLAPTSTERRMQQVAEVASGYVYYVSLKGVGFGIRDAASACAIARVADAVVIGSKIIQLIDEQPRDRVVPVAAEFLAGIRGALDRQSAQIAKP